MLEDEILNEIDSSSSAWELLFFRWFLELSDRPSGDPTYFILFMSSYLA
jgi:hypothetical protein